MHKKNILITGVPGVGKTTLICKLAESLADLNPTGFYTQEIRQQGVRKGFKLISLDGALSILSHVDIESSARVGKYGVDVKGFESFLDNIDFFNPGLELIVIDEIGKMECKSRKFIQLIDNALNSRKTVLATIARNGGGFIDDVKRRSDIHLVEITAKNRDTINPEISGLIRTSLEK
ncbi:MAG: NTPase [candidate division Zixibacteria bacterium]|nr:NTPase [candidate division Zixibacteria bacterium]